MFKNNKYFFLILILALVFIIVGCSSDDSSKQGEYNLSGAVYSETGEAVSDAKIKFNGVAGKGKNIDFGIATTDEEGRFTKTDLRGKVKLTPIKEGYSFDSKIVSSSKDVIFGNRMDIDSPLRLMASPGSKEAYLHWEVVEGADEYKVYKSNRGDGTFSRIEEENTIKDNAYTVEGLSNGKEYHFVVTAVKNLVESSYSNEVNITPSRDKKVELSEELIILGSSNVDKIEIINENKFEFDDSIEDLEEVKTGDYIYFPNTEKTQNLLVRQVKSIDKSNDKLIIETKEAKLEEVINEANINSLTHSKTSYIQTSEIELAQGVSFKEFPDDYDREISMGIDEVPLIEEHGETLMHLNGEVGVKFDIESSFSFRFGLNELLIKPSMQEFIAAEIWVSGLDVSNSMNPPAIEIAKIPVYHPIPIGPMTIPAETVIPIKVQLNIEEFQLFLTSAPLLSVSNTRSTTGGVSYGVDMQDEIYSVGDWSIGGNVNNKFEFGLPLLGLDFTFDDGDYDGIDSTLFKSEKTIELTAEAITKIAGRQGPFLNPYVDIAQFNSTIEKNNNDNQLWELKTPGRGGGLRVGSYTGGLDEITSKVPDELSYDLSFEFGDELFENYFTRYEFNSIGVPQNISLETKDDFIELSWDKVDNAKRYKIYRNPLVPFPGLRGEKIAKTIDSVYEIDKSKVNAGDELVVVSVGEILGLFEYLDLFSESVEIPGDEVDGPRGEPSEEELPDDVEYEIRKEGDNWVVYDENNERMGEMIYNEDDEWFYEPDGDDGSEGGR